MYLTPYLLSCIISIILCNTKCAEIGDNYNGMVVKGNRNALYLVENGARRQFPDFFTFDKMGFNTTSVLKIKDHILADIPIGPMIKAIPQPPAFRADDYMYHEQCEDPDRMVRNYSAAVVIVGSQNAQSSISHLQIECCYKCVCCQC